MLMSSTPCVQHFFGLTIMPPETPGSPFLAPAPVAGAPTPRARRPWAPPCCSASCRPTTLPAGSSSPCSARWTRCLVRPHGGQRGRCTWLRLLAWHTTPAGWRRQAPPGHSTRQSRLRIVLHAPPPRLGAPPHALALPCARPPRPLQTRPTARAAAPSAWRTPTAAPSAPSASSSSAPSATRAGTPVGGHVACLG